MDIEIFMGAIVYIVSTLLTYFIGLISKKKGWNKDIIPIPIQNICIAFICFVVILLVNIIFQLNVDTQYVLMYLISAFGGAGTATLSYDIGKANNSSNDEEIDG